MHSNFKITAFALDLLLTCNFNCDLMETIKCMHLMFRKPFSLSFSHIIYQAEFRCESGSYNQDTLLLHDGGGLLSVYAFAA